AYVDEGGVFRVGPQSAGADPGPACYGRGGTEPTSTDAQLVLGRLRPDRGLLGGGMLLDLTLAQAAMQQVAERLDMSVEEAEFGATERHPLKTLDRAKLRDRYEELVGQAVGQLDADGVPEDRRLVRRLADCRYAGQGYEVRFDVPPGEIDDAWVEQLRESFHAAHEAEYGHRFDAEIEIINVRAVGIGRVDELQPTELEQGDGDPSQARTLDRKSVVEGKRGVVWERRRTE